MLHTTSVEGCSIEDADIICKNTIQGLISAEKKLEEIQEECVLCRDRMECITTKEHSWCQEERKARIRKQEQYRDEAAKFILDNKEHILKSRNMHWQYKLKVKQVLDA